MILTGEEFHRIVDHAEREYPNECCGAILVKDGPPEERFFHACRNVQDEFHRREPARYPRTARAAFIIGKDDFEVIDEKVARGYRPIFYHSHIDADAYFSETDKQMARLVLYPNAIHLVISVKQGKVVDCKAFAWDPQQDDFPSIPFEKPWPL